MDERDLEAPVDQKALTAAGLMHGNRILLAILLVAALSGTGWAKQGFSLRSPPFPVLRLAPGDSELDIKYDLNLFRSDLLTHNDSRSIYNTAHADLYTAVNEYLTWGGGFAFQYALTHVDSRFPDGTRTTIDFHERGFLLS